MVDLSETLRVLAIELDDPISTLEGLLHDLAEAEEEEGNDTDFSNLSAFLGALHGILSRTVSVANDVRNRTPVNSEDVRVLTIHLNAAAFWLNHR